MAQSTTSAARPGVLNVNEPAYESPQSTLLLAVCCPVSKNEILGRFFKMVHLLERCEKKNYAGFCVQNLQGFYPK